MAAVFVANWTSELRSLQTDLSSASFQPASLPSLSASAQALSSQLTEWAERIPTFELRRCEAELKVLTDSLAAASSKANPKAKFSFKKRAPVDPTPAPLAAASSSSAASAPAARPPTSPRSKAPPIPSSAMKLTSPPSRYLTTADLPPAAADSNALVVSDLDACFVDLLAGAGGSDELGKVSALYLYDLKRTVVLIPPIEGSVMLHGCEDCLIVVGGHQFRMHASKRCRVFLQVGSTPIIEACESLHFGPYPPIFTSTPLPPSQFASVQDFDHPFASPSAPSPNWRVLRDEECSWREEWKAEEGRQGSWEELRKGNVPMV